MVYNIYFYSSGAKSVPVHLADISNCYSPDQKQYLQFQMTGSNTGNENVAKFTDEFAKKILQENGGKIWIKPENYQKKMRKKLKNEKKKKI